MVATEKQFAIGQRSPNLCLGSASITAIKGSERQRGNHCCSQLENPGFAIGELELAANLFCDPEIDGALGPSKCVVSGIAPELFTELNWGEERLVLMYQFCLVCWGLYGLNPATSSALDQNRHR